MAYVGYSGTAAAFFEANALVRRASRRQEETTMMLRRAAFPQQVGCRTFDVYLLWQEAGDLSGEGWPLPVLFEEPLQMERIVQSPPFRQAIANCFPPEATVEILPSALGRFYVRVLTPPVANEEPQRAAAIPLPAVSSA